jgi:hypothetical protein
MQRYKSKEHGKGIRNVLCLMWGPEGTKDKEGQAQCRQADPKYTNSYTSSTLVHQRRNKTRTYTGIDYRGAKGAHQNLYFRIRVPDVLHLHFKI